MTRRSKLHPVVDSRHVASGAAFPTRAVRAALFGCLIPLALTACRTQAPAEETPAGDLGFMDVLAKAPSRPVEAEVATGVGEFQSGGELAQPEWELDPEQWAARLTQDLAALDAKPEPPPPAVLEPRENPYLAFGSRIIVHDNGLIVKPYPLPLGKAEKILQFMSLYANFPIDRVDPGTLDVATAGPDRVLAEVLPGWEVEYFRDLRKETATPETPRPIADWLVITTGPDLLHEVEAFINLFLAEVPQIEIEAKIVEVTESADLDLGVRRLDQVDPPPIASFPDDKLLKNFNYDFPNVTGGGLLTIGAVLDGTTFNMLIQAAASSNDVEISSQPKIAVREGARAEILNTTELPVLNISSVNQAGNFTAGLTYKEVGVKLYIVPAVIGTDTVALYVDIEASQQIGAQSFFVVTDQSPNNDSKELTEILAPVLANRSAKTVIYLRPGEGVILGGLTTERVVSNVRKVPILGSIPLLGFFFRSSFDRVERTSVLFFIRPRILEGIDLQREF